jgi:hypothetical protein
MQTIVDRSKKFRKNIAERPSHEPISRMCSGRSRKGESTRRHRLKLPDAQSLVNSFSWNQAR